MSDFFYKFVRMIGRPIVFGAARSLVLHEDRARLSGGCLLAANHHSYFDSMVLVGTTTRLIDWLSIVELFQTPWQKQFMTGINCLALDRSRADSTTTRQVISRLKTGRMVGFFPEAEMRQGHSSVIYGGNFNTSAARLAEMGRVPILPVVVLGAGQFVHPKAWIPGAGTFLAINYGEPIYLRADLAKTDARQQMEQALHEAFPDLFAEIQNHPEWRKNATGPWWRKNYSD